MFREIVKNKHYLFAKNADTWEEAIRLGCSTLIADGTAEAAYADTVIESIRRYGPYIVLRPGVAMPHAQGDTGLVHRSSISFMRLEKPVIFDKNDPGKHADLFFTLTALDPDAHLENIRILMKILECEEILAALRSTGSEDDLLRIADQYGI